MDLIPHYHNPRLRTMTHAGYKSFNKSILLQISFLTERAEERGVFRDQNLGGDLSLSFDLSLGVSA